jgi:hypothetical protein
MGIKKEITETPVAHFLDIEKIFLEINPHSSFHNGQCVSVT